MSSKEKFDLCEYYNFADSSNRILPIAIASCVSSPETS